MSDDFETPAEQPTHRRLAKADILAGVPVPTKEVYIPMLNGTVMVRAVNRMDLHAAKQRAIVRLKGGGQEIDTERLEKYLLVLGLADPTFTYQEVESLMRMPLAVVQTILNAVDELSGMTQEERAEVASSFRVGPGADA